MNQSLYRLVFNSRTASLVPVAESTACQGKAHTGEGAAGQAQGSRGAAQLDGLAPRIRILSYAVALAVVGAVGMSPKASYAQTLPTGGTVTYGSAAISTSGNTMTVNQNSQVLGANWQSFNIGAGNTVVFNQPSSSSVAVNRVTGTSQSQIYGNLQANGQVYLLNPNGVLFGPSSQVLVGAFVSSTKNITDGQLAAGDYTLMGSSNPSTPSNATVVNQGNITAVGGSTGNGTAPGYVVLHADRVTNNGTIVANGGRIVLAASSVLGLSLSSGQLIGVQAVGDVVNALVANKGLIVADGGNVLLTAKGKDTLLQTVVNNSGVIQARALSSKGGVISLMGESGDVIQSGKIDVSGSAQGQSAGAVVVSGDRIALTGGSSIDASGYQQGGRVIVGGDLLKKATDIANISIANQTVVQTGSSINIGSSHGDGGFVETSGKQLGMSGTVTGSAAGKAGQWLIDPADVTISTAVNSNVSTGLIFSPTGNNMVVNNGSIVTALNNGLSVTVTTAGAGEQAGSIIVNANIVKTAGGAATLSLLANASIHVSNVNISSSSNALNVNLQADQSRLGKGKIVLSALTVVNTNGGNLTARANTTGVTGAAITLQGNITATGNMSDINGRATTDSGVVFLGGNQTIAGNIIGFSQQENGVLFSAGNQTITGGVMGTSLSATQSSFGFGVNFLGGKQVINGAVSGSSAAAAGVAFNAGNQTVTGSIAGSGNASNGVEFGFGNQLVNGNVTGTSSTLSGVVLGYGNRTINGAVIGASATSDGVISSSGNQFINGSLSGTSNATGSGVAVYAGVTGITTVLGNTTGRSVDGAGVYFEGSFSSNGSIVGTATGFGTGVRFFGGNQSITGTLKGKSTNNNGLLWQGGNQTVNASISGTSNYSTGIKFGAGQRTVTGTVTGKSTTGTAIEVSAGTLKYTGSLTLAGTTTSGTSAFLMTGGTITTTGVGNLQIKGGTQTSSAANAIRLNAGNISVGNNSVTLNNYGALISQSNAHSIQANTLFLTGNGSTSIQGQNGNTVVMNQR